MGIKATGFVGFTRRGKGIESITEYIKFNKGARPGENDSDWKTREEREAAGLITEPTDTWPYMWKKTVTKWTTGETAIVIETVCIKGQDGTNGENGKDGKRGLYIPTPRLWSDYPEQYKFQSGGETDERLDIVLHEYSGKIYAYSCKMNHNKATGSAAEPAVGASRDIFWEAGQQWTFIATRVLFAELARVQNLCAEYIQMLDADGKVIFEALGDESGGHVICNRGTFKNVDVEGSLTAGDANGKHITIDPDSKTIRIYDDEGNLRAELDGSAYTSAQLMPGSAGGSLTVTTPQASLTAEGSGSLAATDSCVVTSAYESATPGALQIQTTAAVSMAGTLARAASVGTDGATIEKPTMARQATVTCVVTTRNASGAVINTVRRPVVAWAELADGSSHTQQATRTFTVAVPAGKHTVSFELRASGSTATASVQTGGVTFVAEWFMARYFSNGLALTQNTLNYLIALYESGVMKLLLGGEFHIDGVKQPKVVYAGQVTDSTKDGSTGASKTDMTFPGSSSGVTLTKGANAAAGYTLTFPAKYGLTPTNAIIELTGLGPVAGDTTSPAKPAVKSYSAGTGGAFTVVVWVSDDNTPNFGGFYIKVSKV